MGGIVQEALQQSEEGRRMHVTHVCYGPMHIPRYGRIHILGLTITIS